MVEEINAGMIKKSSTFLRCQGMTRKNCEYLVITFNDGTIFTNDFMKFLVKLFIEIGGVVDITKCPRLMLISQFVLNAFQYKELIGLIKYHGDILQLGDAVYAALSERYGDPEQDPKVNNAVLWTMMRKDEIAAHEERCQLMEDF